MAGMEFRLIDYAAVTKAWRRNKSALTKAQNKGDHRKVLEVCDRAFADMDEYGYPDNWALFQRARDDAQWAIRREEW